MKEASVYSRSYVSLRLDVTLPNSSNHRPPTTEVDDIPAESFVPISISNRDIDVMVHKNPSVHRIVVHALSARPVHIAVRFQYDRAAAFETVRSICVDLCNCQPGSQKEVNIELGIQIHPSHSSTGTP